MKKTFFFLLTPFLFFTFLIPLNVVSSTDFGPPPGKFESDPNVYLEPVRRKEQEKKEYKEEHPILYYFKYPISKFISSLYIEDIFYSFGFSLISTLVIKVLVAEIIILFTVITRKLLFSVALANLISLIFLFVAMFLGGLVAAIINMDEGTFLLSSIGFILLLEITVVILEGYLIAGLTKKLFDKEISRKFSFALSIIINIFSGVPYIFLLLINNPIF